MGAKHPTALEAEYSRKLRKVANVVGDMINHHTIIEKDKVTGQIKIVLHHGLQELLKKYSESITPFAERLAMDMINRVDKNNAKWWNANAKKFSKQLQSDRFASMNGLIATKLQNEQVTLIKSLPLQAGQRAQELAIKAHTEGMRAADIVDEIRRSGDITASRANTIARTEIAKANATFTRARATYVGANKYIWHTMKDENTRDSHLEMDGKICDYDNPPTLSDGNSVNAGEFVNCRCYSEPVLSKD